MGFCLVLAVSLIFIALPRLLSSLALVPGNSALIALQLREEVGSAEIERVIVSRENARLWLRSPRILSDLALARMARLDRDGRALHETAKAREELHRSILASPANPYSWIRLALLDYQTVDLAAIAGDEWAMAIRTGPREPELVAAYVDLGLNLWTSLTVEQRRLLFDQIRFAALRRVGDLVRVARSSRELKIVRIALLGDPERLARFNAALAYVRRRS